MDGCDGVRLRETLSFEAKQGFDRSRTLKIIVRRRPKLEEIKKVFEGYKVEWESGVKVYTNRAVHRVQAVYLEFKSGQEARRVYSRRQELMEQLKQCDPIIKSLYEEPKSILEPKAEHVATAVRYRYAPAQLLASVKSVAEVEEAGGGGGGGGGAEEAEPERAAFY